jgi:hypothetical protein
MEEGIRTLSAASVSTRPPDASTEKLSVSTEIREGGEGRIQGGWGLPHQASGVFLEVRNMPGIRGIKKDGRDLRVTSAREIGILQP